jgi:hypothetical protein
VVCKWTVGRAAFITVLLVPLIGAPAATGKEQAKAVTGTLSVSPSVLPVAAHRVFFSEQTGDVTIYDTRRNRRAFRRSLGQGCGATDGAFGHILVICRQGASEFPWLLDASSKQYTPVPGAQGKPGTNSIPQLDRFTAIRRYWIGGSRCNMGCHGVYVNFRTGEVREGFVDGPTLDLSSRDLVTLRRPKPAVYMGGSSRQWLLYRPPGGGRRLISTCPLYCFVGAFSGPRVIWLAEEQPFTTARDAYGYSLSTGQRFHWRARDLPGARRGELFVNTTTTSDATFFTTRLGNGYRLYQWTWTNRHRSK